MDYIEILKILDFGGSAKDLHENCKGIGSIGAAANYIKAYKILKGRYSLKKLSTYNEVVRLSKEHSINEVMSLMGVSETIVRTNLKIYKISTEMSEFISQSSPGTSEGVKCDIDCPSISIQDEPLIDVGVVEKYFDKYESDKQSLVDSYYGILQSIDLLLEYIRESKDILYDEIGKCNVLQQKYLHRMENSRSEEELFEATKEFYAFRKERRYIKTKNMLGGHIIRSLKAARIHSDQIVLFRNSLLEYVDSINNFTLESEKEEI